MDTISDAVLSSLEFNPWVLIPTLILGLLRHRMGTTTQACHIVSNTHSSSLFWWADDYLCALTSPLDAFAGWLLTVHMIQHCC